MAKRKPTDTGHPRDGGEGGPKLGDNRGHGDPPVDGATSRGGRAINSTATALVFGAVAIGCALLWAIATERHHPFRKPSWTKGGAKSGPIVAGYLPEYRSYIDLDAAAAHLTDVILFSISPNADGSTSGTCCLDGSHYAKARAAREHCSRRALTAEEESSEDLRILVSVGGAGRSDSFPTMAFDAGRRKKLVNELISLCQKEHLDGVDFDWESPRTRSDLHAYSVLLQEASEAFHAAGLLLSVALHPGQFLPPPAYDAVDRVNLMTYDMIERRGPGDGSGTGTGFKHHATYDRMVREVEALFDSGCPRSKIVLGVPAYARHTQNPGLVKTYSEIMDSIKERGSLPEPHELETMDNYDGYSFDSPADVQKKVRYAVEDKLGGVFFWEAGQDWQNGELASGGMLLGAATQAMRGWRAVGPSSSEDGEL